MAFDVSKFLALTALIATTGAACSSTDDKPEGSAGTTGAGTAGKPGDAGSSSQGGSAASAGQNAGGEGGGYAGESSEPELGGAGGNGGDGGQAGSEECVGPLLGAGGGADVDPSLEGLCLDFWDATCPASEDEAPTYKVCEGVKERATPGVAVKVAECLKALSTADACDESKVAACFTSLVGKGCINPDADAACASVHANCGAVTVESCKKTANLVENYEALTGCMDPGDEGWYEPEFTGTCVERLEYCAGVRL
jgi:hypothetical protein